MPLISRPRPLAPAGHCNCRVSVGEMAAALRRAGGEAAYTRIRWQPDPQIQSIVTGWPQALATPRAEALGFGRDRDIDEVIAAFIEDDLPMQKELAG
jgi:nucleoside-diphosphate-sugar epimerase